MPPKKMVVNSKSEAARVRNSATESEYKEREARDKETAGEGAENRAVAAARKSDARRIAELEEKELEKANRVSFLAFEEAELPNLKEEKPGLTHIQYKDMIWNLWKTSPHNSLNQRPHCCCRAKTSLMRPFPQLLDHEEVIFSWALQRRRTRPQPQLLSKCRKLTLQWGHTHHRTSSRLHAQPRRSSTKNLKNPPRHVFEQGLTSGAPKQTQRQANMNPMVTQSTRQPTYTVFGYEDYHLQCMKEHYRKKNIGIVIREESELKIMRKENQRKLRSKEKGKENQKGKEKENQSPNLPVSWDDKAIEWKRVHSSTSRGWRKVNKIFVTNNICWPWTLAMDSLSFQRFMYRRHGRA